MTLEELHRLADPEFQAFIYLHRDDDPVAFAMQFHDRKELPVRAIAEQLACRRKAVKKLPKLSYGNMLYSTLALEQASGECTAAYKASFMSGQRIIDMSGGLGVDTMFFARIFKQVIYCERDEVLCALMAHNLEMNGLSNVEIVHAESPGYLASCPDDYFDWIYVDPSRREQGRRSIGLQASSPDVVACHDLLLRKARRVCIKASPALELSALHLQLPSLSSMIVVSVDLECREILLLLDRERKSDSPIAVRAACLKSGSEEKTEIDGDGEVPKIVADSLKACFYEPDPAIIKAKLTPRLARVSGLEFVNKRVDYLTGDRMIRSFPGKMFRIVESVPYKPKSFLAFIEKHRLDVTGASVQRRDFPLSPDEIRRKYRLKENERAFLFFTKDSSGGFFCIYGIRCFPSGGEVPSGQGQNEAPGC
ncbi:MAG: hypothetical protein HGA62_02485 [Chlorobiaceae bacterium]|nr:hypothetical protein [Chlorobiaceae bacterium]NTV60738.1 hypothetical protein [Chlorobiaceae bacterium]